MPEYRNLQKSLKNLETQNENRKNLPSDQPQYVREALDESVIQRFEVCYDTLLKSLRRYLIDEVRLPSFPPSPRPIFRLAGENEVLDSPVERWMEYVNLRVGTTHDYSSEKAAAVLERVDDFISDAIGLYQAMTGEEWE
jgi:nucleotidyltransferase substrate binding protein (TIGR01987 family)